MVEKLSPVATGSPRLETVLDSEYGVVVPAWRKRHLAVVVIPQIDDLRLVAQTRPLRCRPAAAHRQVVRPWAGGCATAPSPTGGEAISPRVNRSR